MDSFLEAWLEVLEIAENGDLYDMYKSSLEQYLCFRYSTESAYCKGEFGYGDVENKNYEKRKYPGIIQHIVGL